MSEVSVTIKNQSIRVTQKNDQIIIRTVVTNTLQTINVGGGGSGDVVGPNGGVTDNHIVLFDGATGKLIKTSGQDLSAYQPLLGYTPSRRLVHKNNVSDSFTGTTNESILASVLIPAGTVGANDVINIVVRTRKSGTNGNWSVRGRIHTSGGSVGTAFSSGTQFFVTGTMTSTTLYTKLSRELVFKNSLTSITVYPTTAGAVSNTLIDNVQLATDISTLTNDFSADQYIVITGLPVSSLDTIIIDHIYIEIIRS